MPDQTSILAQEPKDSKTPCIMSELGSSSSASRHGEDFCVESGSPHNEASSVDHDTVNQRSSISATDSDGGSIHHRKHCCVQ